jgi:uncharacterized protein YqgC (DUF456 family)
MMDIVLIIFGSFLMLLGLIGCILPALPGPPLSFVGILLLHFTKQFGFSTKFLIVWGILTLVVTIFDYLIPIWGTETFGGSRYGIWGSIIGLLTGMVWPPMGIIIGPLVGAIVGEIIGGQKDNALRAGFGSFVGFLGGIILKLIASGMMLFYFVAELI